MRTNTLNSFFLSLLLHAGFVAVLIVCATIASHTANEFSYVEVSFGLNENLVQTRQNTPAKLPEGEREALKAKDALPQLTKNSAPKLPEQEKKVESEDALKLKDPIQKSEKTVQNKTLNLKLENQKDGHLDTKDFLKRKEESMRKSGEIAQTGQKQIDKTKPIGVKHSINDIPRSPFETVKTANAPASIAPTGVETGTSTYPLDTYKIYLRNQLKLNWNLPNTSTFAPSLTTTISFTVNEFGYLIETPKIVQSSSNNAFDNLVIEAVRATFPVSTPPPKEIHPPQTFLIRYNVKDVR